MIGKLLNINKKLYIIVNNKVADKGKIARACATIGQSNPNFGKVIVLKGDDKYLELREKYQNEISGEHIDAGFTQVSFGTSLAFGIIKKNSENIDLKLF